MELSASKHLPNVGYCLLKYDNCGAKKILPQYTNTATLDDLSMIKNNLHFIVLPCFKAPGFFFFGALNFASYQSICRICFKYKLN